LVPFLVEKQPYNNRMTTTGSAWRTRIEELVDLLIREHIFNPSVTTNTIGNTLHYWAVIEAKHLNNMGLQCPRENPWLASLMLYFCLGDHSPSAVFSDSTRLEAGVLIGIIDRAGWHVQDVLQAVEWIKETMPYYPTAEQWASTFNIDEHVVISAQKTLQSDMISLLTPNEKSAWTVTCNLEAPFYYWTAQLNKTEPGHTLSLPALDIDI
jgi:hypothetical protein